MKIELRITCIILLILTATFKISEVRADELPRVNIGIILDGPWEKNEGVLSILKQEILELTRGEFDVQFPTDKTIEANWSVASIRVAINKLIADPGVDMLIAAGVISSQEVCRLERIPKPVIAPVVLDPILQGLPHKNGTSGMKNLSYVHSPSRLLNEIKYFQEIVPFKNLIILTSKAFDEAVPQFIHRARDMTKEMDLRLNIVPVGTSADEALSSIPPDAQAIFIGTLFQMPAGEFQKLVQGIIDRGLPSFALWGKMDVEKGILAGMLPETFIERLTRRVALIIQRILLGEKPEEIPVAFAPKVHLTINMATARAIGIYPSWAILTEAELLNPVRQESERILNLEKVVHEALKVNLDLAASEMFVTAGEQEVNIARSNLLPQIDISTLGLVIDKDRADASFGSQAERTFSGSVKATQLLFSEPAWANLSIQRDIHKSRMFEHDQLRLDIVLSATVAYLNVLRAKTFEQIQRENLKRSRENLELAEVRQSVGYSGPSDVYRWESQIATNRKDVIKVNSQRNLAEIEMNRILNRPLEENFITEEIDLNDLNSMNQANPLLKYMKNKRDFKILRSFLAKEGLANSPEIQRLDAAISSQRRLLRSTKNAFWLPTIALQGELTHRFKQEGAGSDGSHSFNLPSNFDIDFPEIDETDWNVGLSMSFPLFKGAAKFAEKKQSLEELLQLQLERKAVIEKIEQRIRSSMHTAGASYAIIQQTQNAAEASQKNLDLVFDAYSRGAVSIIELIDAQNAALVADQGSSNAIYDFLIDLMRAERSIGKFDILRSEKSRKDFYNRLNRYYNEAIRK